MTSGGDIHDGVDVAVRGFSSRPDGLGSAGNFFTQDLQLKPLLLCRGNVMLELCECDGGPVEGGAIPRIKSGSSSFVLSTSTSAWSEAMILGNVSSACLSLKLIRRFEGGPEIFDTKAWRLSAVRVWAGRAKVARHVAPACRCSPRHIRSKGHLLPARSRY